jgi:hypothetical protein
MPTLEGNKRFNRILMCLNVYSLAVKAKLSWFSLSTTSWRRMGKWRYSSTVLTSALYGGVWSASCSCTRGQSPRHALEPVWTQWRRNKCLFPARNRSPVVQSVEWSLCWPTCLYCLLFFSSCFPEFYRRRKRSCWSHLSRSVRCWTSWAAELGMRNTLSAWMLCYSV